MGYIGIIVMLIIVLLVGLLVSASRLPRLVKQIIYVGLALRVVGAVVRYRVIFDYYERGDAIGYFEHGLVHAVAFKVFDFSALSELFATGDLWGTNFVRVLSGIALTVLGPSLFAEFLLFSLAAFAGLLCFGLAFRRLNPDGAFYKYLVWIMIFPSLWFWPASLGKEAVILLGLGIAVLGYVGRRQKIQWLPMLMGGFIVFATRPELASVLLASMLIAQWFSLTKRWTIQTIVQTVLVTGVALYGLRSATEYMGIEEWGPEGVQSYIETDPSRRATGKTNVTAVGISLLQAPLAAVNTLIRPFPWEATNIMVLASSFEVMGFLTIVFFRRRNLMTSVRLWRSDRLLRLALAFSILYPVGLGMMVVNLGVIARQRVLLFPFLFVLLEAQPRLQAAVANRKASRAMRRRTYSPEATVEQPSRISNSLPPGTTLSRISMALDSQTPTNTISRPCWRG